MDKKILVAFAIMALPIAASASSFEDKLNRILLPDTSRVFDLDEVVVVAQPKENYKLRRQSLSSSVFTNYVGDYVFNVKDNITSFKIDEPVEVLELGTGFMMIRKETLLKFAEAFPEYKYRPDHIRSAAFDGTREITQFFQAEIDQKTKRYLSEDYWFTQKVQELGMRCYLAPWIQLQHAGTYIFGGSLGHLASLGVSPTADVSKISKNKQ
jgi:hypothetical protein